MKIAYILVTCLFLFGCESQKRKITLTPTRELIFNTGFPIHNKSTGIIDVGKDSTQMIYFSNLTSDKKISLFTMKGKHLKDIPTNSISNLNEEIDAFQIISPDTIIFITHYTNKIFVLNSKGECWKKINLNEVVVPENGDVYEYTGSSFGDFVFDGKSLYLSCEWRGNINTKEPTDAFEQLKYFYANCSKAPVLLKIDNIWAKKLSHSFVLKKYYESIDNGLKCFFETSNYTVTNNGVYKFSWYANEVIHLDPKTSKPDKTITINSKYSPLAVKPFELTKKDFQNIQQQVSERIPTSGKIIRFLYDSDRKLYYVIVNHSMKKGEDPKTYTRKNSLIVLDEEFNTLNEMLLDPDKYSEGNTKVCKEGLLISTNLTSRKDYDRNISRYMLFKINEKN